MCGMAGLDEIMYDIYLFLQNTNVFNLAQFFPSSIFRVYSVFNAWVYTKLLVYEKPDFGKHEWT